MVMTAEELRALDSRFVAIGSHCITHKNLTSMDDEEASNEIHESKKTLENILGREVPTVSFPHGVYDEGHIERPGRRGIKKVFTISSALAYQNR